MSLQVMRNRILDDLNRSDLTSIAESQIKTSIAYYEKRRFWFLEERAVATTVVGQEYYALPNDFRDDDSLVITVSNNAYPLNRRTYETLEDWFVRSETFTGFPTDYAIYQEQFRLYPVPNGLYPLRLSYIKQLASLDVPTDTNEWMEEGEGLIRNRSEWVLFAQKLRDFDAAQACKMLETEELREHERLTTARLLTGHTRKRKM